jgi:hypothetical protein
VKIDFDDGVTIEHKKVKSTWKYDFELFPFINVAEPDLFNYECLHEGKVISSRKNVSKHQLVVEIKYIDYTKIKEIFICAVEHQISAQKMIYTLHLFTGEK